jgi:hypothetical protein
MSKDWKDVKIDNPELFVETVRQMMEDNRWCVIDLNGFIIRVLHYEIVDTNRKVRTIVKERKIVPGKGWQDVKYNG